MVVKEETMAETRPQKVVVSITSMSTEQFAMHFTKRHRGSLAGLSELPADMTFEVEQMYRAFHERLHETRVGYKHCHEPPDIEYSVDRAIECLFENNNWGWKKLAGINALVAVFPDGQIAVKTGKVTWHFKEIDEATDCLIDFAN